MSDLDLLMSVSSTLSDEDIGFLLRQAQALADAREADSIDVSVTDVSPKRTDKRRRRCISENPPCIYCQSTSVVKDGKRHKKQRYWCKSCNRTFVPTTNTVMANSHFGMDVWRELVNDTFNGESIDSSAEKYGISHPTIFSMRHKVLVAVIIYARKDPIMLGNVSEVDETYVLESFKGVKFAEDAPRKPRKRGGTATKRGLSDEQICICTGVERKGVAYATTVNRAKPSNKEIQDALSGHISEGTILFSDGLKSYKVLEDSIDCIVESVPVEEMKKSKTANLNNVNSFHSFIKERYRKYRGVATKYINRYNVLFSKGFRDRKATIDAICQIILEDQSMDRSVTVKELKEWDLTLL